MFIRGLYHICFALRVNVGMGYNSVCLVNYYGCLDRLEGIYSFPQGHWQPEDNKNSYHVAIKVLNSDSASPEASRELLQEGVVMAAIDHPNVVRLYAVCMGKQIMLVSQFVPLGSLISYLKKNKEYLNAQVMLSFATQIAQVCGACCITFCIVINKMMKVLSVDNLITRNLSCRRFD